MCWLDWHRRCFGLDYSHHNVCSCVLPQERTGKGKMCHPGCCLLYIFFSGCCLWKSDLCSGIFTEVFDCINDSYRKAKVMSNRAFGHDLWCSNLK